MTPEEYAEKVVRDFPATAYFDAAWREKMARTIGAAVAAERERCAKIAEADAAAFDEGVRHGVEAWPSNACAAALRVCASEIRAAGK